MIIGQRDKEKNAHQPLFSHVLKYYWMELTFAGLHAFRPSVLNVAAAKSSAVFEPSTTRSATTDSTGLMERATLWAH